MKERLPHLALGVAMVAISLSAIFIRWSDSSPLVAAAHRQAFATLLFLPPLLWNRAAGLRRLTRRELTSMAVIGLLRTRVTSAAPRSASCGSASARCCWSMAWRRRSAAARSAGWSRRPTTAAPT